MTVPLRCADCGWEFDAERAHLDHVQKHRLEDPGATEDSEDCGHRWIGMELTKHYAPQGGRNVFDYCDAEIVCSRCGLYRRILVHGVDESDYPG